VVEIHQIGAGRRGMLHAWRTDGDGTQLLPRALVWGRLLDKIEAVVGVAGGFVLAGRDHQGGVAIAHYDLGERTCQAHVLGETKAAYDWCYSPEHHAVLAYAPGGSLACALDLATGARYPGGEFDESARVREAWYAATEGRVPPRRLLCLMTAASFKVPVQTCFLDRARGEITLSGPKPPWEPFAPLADGLPVLRDCSLYAAKCRGNVLAAVARRRERGSPLMLRLFRGPDGTPLAEYEVTHAESAFALSADGKLLARQLRNGCVEVRDTRGGGPLLTTFVGGFAHGGQVLLGKRWLLLQAGKGNHYHLLRWDSGRLELRHTREGRWTPEGPAVLAAEDLRPLIQAGLLDPWDASFEVPAPDGVPALLHYDRERFIRAVAGAVTVVLDRFGQVAILDAKNRVVCMFFAFRDGLSAWLPDGTCFGPASHTGAPPTPADLEKVGRALARASAGRAP
jgi:hypothetical protein